MKPICGSRGMAGLSGCILDKGHEGGHLYGNTIIEENRREKAYVRELEQQLANAIKQNVMLRDGLKRADDLLRNSYDHVSPLIREALAATADLSGLVLCYAEPMAHYVYIAEQQTGYVVEDLEDAMDDLTNTNATTEPLFRRKP